MNSSEEQGFTLVEVLVSFAILSGVIILAFQVTAGSLGAMRDAALKSQATEIVSAEVNRRVAQSALKLGIEQGTTKGVHWTISTTPLDDEAGGSELRPWRVKAYAPGNILVLETVVLER